MHMICITVSDVLAFPILKYLANTIIIYVLFKLIYEEQLPK